MPPHGATGGWGGTGRVLKTNLFCMHLCVHAGVRVGGILGAKPGPPVKHYKAGVSPIKPYKVGVGAPPKPYKAGGAPPKPYNVGGPPLKPYKAG